MPCSYPGLHHYLATDINTLVKPKTVFDVGVGTGSMGKLVRSTAFASAHITGWEVFLCGVNVEARYDAFHAEDFLAWTRKNVDWEVDLVTFGDVLEHFRHSEAMDILDEAAYRSRWIALFTPGLYFQNTYGGNIDEAHRCVLTLQDLARFRVAHFVQDTESQFLHTYCLLRGRIL